MPPVSPLFANVCLFDASNYAFVTSTYLLALMIKCLHDPKKKHFTRLMLVSTPIAMFCWKVLTCEMKSKCQTKSCFCKPLVRVHNTWTIFKLFGKRKKKKKRIFPSCCLYSPCCLYSLHKNIESFTFPRIVTRIKYFRQSVLVLSPYHVLVMIN